VIRGSLAVAGLVLLLAGHGGVTGHGGRSTGARGGMASPVLHAGLAANAGPAPASRVRMPRLPPVSPVPHVPHVPHVGRSSADDHDLHETYADLAIEDRVIGGRLRFYKKDLERALGPMLQSDAVSLTPGPEADALVLRYLKDHLTFVADDTLEATVVRGEEVRMGHHPGWQVTLSWEGHGPVTELRVRNTLLFELHDDQRNVMRFVRLPEQRRVTLTLEPGTAEGVVGR
jgi:hypothetical protein